MHGHVGFLSPRSTAQGFPPTWHILAKNQRHLPSRNRRLINVQLEIDLSVQKATPFLSRAEAKRIRMLFQCLKNITAIEKNLTSVALCKFAQNFKFSIRNWVCMVLESPQVQKLKISFVNFENQAKIDKTLPPKLTKKLDPVWSFDKKLDPILQMGLLIAKK